MGVNAIPLVRPSTCTSFVSVSVAPEEKYINSQLLNLDEIYKNNIFPNTVGGDTPIMEISENFGEANSSRQNSETSVTSSISNNCNTISLSPSLKSIYSTRRASSFRNSYYNRLNSLSDDDIKMKNHTFSFISHRSSLTSFGSLDFKKDDHPLLGADSVIESDNDSDSDLDSHSDLQLNNKSDGQYSPAFDERIAGNQRLRTSVVFDVDYDDFDKHHSNNGDDASNQELNKLSNIDTKIPLWKTNSFFSFFKKLHRGSVRLSDHMTSANKHKNPINFTKDVPLETFSQIFETLPIAYHENVSIDSQIHPEAILPLYFDGKTRRYRENRINSRYLLQFATDNSARTKGLLNCITDEEIDIFDNLVLEMYPNNEDTPPPLHFDFSDDKVSSDVFQWKLKLRFQDARMFKQVDDLYIFYLKLASISRCKLWENVTLPPRPDPVPNLESITNDISPASSLDCCQVPWLNIKDLKSGRAVNRLTKCAGMLKSSNVQYVSKRGTSKRWSCFNS